MRITNTIALWILAIMVLMTVSTMQDLYSQIQYREIEVTNGGTITGQVSIKDDAPQIEMLEVNKDVQHCGSSTPSPRLSVGKNNGLKNAVVYLKDVEKGKRLNRDESVVLDQKDCQFTPHVVLLPFGGKLEIVNSDDILHNVRAYHTKDGRTIFNIAQPIKGQRTSIRPAAFERPGIYHTVCDAAHPWMSAFIVVKEHPYYPVTAEDGSFTIENIPPSEYTLKIWHGGVNIDDTVVSSGEVVQYRYEDPYTFSKEVEVKTEEETSVKVRLALR